MFGRFSRILTFGRDYFWQRLFGNALFIRGAALHGGDAAAAAAADLAAERGTAAAVKILDVFQNYKWRHGQRRANWRTLIGRRLGCFKAF